MRKDIVFLVLVFFVGFLLFGCVSEKQALDNAIPSNYDFQEFNKTLSDGCVIRCVMAWNAGLTNTLSCDWRACESNVALK